MRKTRELVSAFGRLRAGALAFALSITLAVGGLITFDASPAWAQTGGEVPGNALGSTSDTDFWSEIRRGDGGTVSIPDKKAAILVQSEGEEWRNFRNGPLSVWGAWAVIGVVGLLALFYVFRGRIKIESGFAGKHIERFNDIDRFAHWITAVSFILLALTGLNLLFGRYVLLPVIGPEAFSWISQLGKYVHNYVAFAFIAGIALMLILWVRHNIPNKHDLVWLSKAGGLFSSHSHPPAKKFNAGQKILFWLVILGGGSVSASGLSLLMPYELPMMAGTFAFLNSIGITMFPAEITVFQEMQYSQIWHTLVSLVLIAVVIAHIYIGSVGMQGAFDAMGSGHVDLNWAKEHHPLWVEEEAAKGTLQEHVEPAGAKAQPAGGDD